MFHQRFRPHDRENMELSGKRLIAMTVGIPTCYDG